MRHLVKIVIAIFVLLAVLPIVLTIDLSPNLEESDELDVQEYVEPIQGRSMELVESEDEVIEQEPVEEMEPAIDKKINIAIGAVSVTAIFVAVGGLTFMLNKEVKL